MTRAELLRSDLSPTTRAALVGRAGTETGLEPRPASGARKDTRQKTKAAESKRIAPPTRQQITLPWLEACAIQPLTLVLPLPPTLANASGASRHFRAVAKKRTEYLGKCDLLLMARKIERPPRLPLERARLALAFGVGALHDMDNLCARAKPAIDWLVRAGYVVDDSPAHIEWAGLPTQRVVQRGCTVLVAILTPLPTTP